MFKAGDMCKFKGSKGYRRDLVQLDEYDTANKTWMAISPVYGMMSILSQDVEKLPKNFQVVQET